MNKSRNDSRVHGVLSDHREEDEKRALLSENCSFVGSSVLDDPSTLDSSFPDSGILSTVIPSWEKFPYRPGTFERVTLEEGLTVT